MIPPTPLLARRGIVASAVVALGAASGCAEADSPNAPPLAVATIFPVGDLAARVGEDDVRIEVLVPPRADPATYEPSPRQIRSLSSARAYLLVGGAVDEWVDGVAQGSAQVPRTRLNEGISAGDAGGTGNPHTWLDPLLVRDVWLPRIEATLSKVNPSARGRLAARARALSDSLTALDAWLSRLLEPVHGQAFIATHAAWEHFSARYGVRELGALHESPGREPSARRLAELVDSARATGVRAVFAEPQLGETAAHALAAELGVPVHELDPLGGPGLEGRDGYLALMRFNGLQIQNALAR